MLGWGWLSSHEKNRNRQLKLAIGMVKTGRCEVKGWFLVILQRLEIKRSQIESPGGSFFHHLFEKYVVMLDHFPQGSS